MIKKFLPLAALPFLMLASCGGGEKDDSQKVVTDTVVETIDIDTMEMSNILPSPLQVAMIFDKSGLEYDGSYCNPLDAVKKYTTKYEQSLNFGVYSADLAYSVLKEKSKEAGEIIKVVRELSTKIGLSTVFEDEDLLGRFEKNLGNKDSVLEVLVEIEEKTDDYIEENGENDLGNVMFAGAWIEGMYIGSMATLKDKKNDIGAKLAEQMIICENLIKGLEMGKTDEDDVLIQDLKDLEAMYKGFESVKGLEGDDAFNVTLTDDEIKVLAEKLINLRKKIVKA